MKEVNEYWTVMSQNKIEYLLNLVCKSYQYNKIKDVYNKVKQLSNIDQSILKKLESRTK